MVNPDNTSTPSLLIYDPITFSGGSKKATINIINLMANEPIDVFIATANPADWQSVTLNKTIYRLYEFNCLAKAEMGIVYFIRHFFLCLQLMLIRVRLGHFNKLIATSGPGVDLALYWFNRTLSQPAKLIQLIQGPIARSKTIAKSLLKADRIYYLPSCLPSIEHCLEHFFAQAKPSDSSALKAHFTHKKQQGHYAEMHNGLSQADWPQKTVTRQTLSNVSIVWTASLLKWKGLDILLDALKLFTPEKRPLTSICYIRPSQTNLAITRAPQSLTRVDWYEHTTELDIIRRNHSVFISTSVQEPFGLAILEAMATGLCVFIPEDGAYWDQVLTHNEHCIKYKANNPVDLKIQLDRLIEHPEKIAKIAQQGKTMAEQYHAEKTYLPIAKQMAKPVHAIPETASVTEK